MFLISHDLASLRSSLFHFLLAGESESQGEVVRKHGARAKRGTGEGGGEERKSFSFPSLPLPPLPLIFVTSVPSPRTTPACLKGNGKDCYTGCDLANNLGSGKSKPSHQWQIMGERYYKNNVSAEANWSIKLVELIPVSVTLTSYM